MNFHVFVAVFFGFGLILSVISCIARACIADDGLGAFLWLLLAAFLTACGAAVAFA